METHPMELFPYNYRASTTIPWKMNKPVTGFYSLVRMSNGFSYESNQKNES